MRDEQKTKKHFSLADDDDDDSLRARRCRERAKILAAAVS